MVDINKQLFIVVNVFPIDGVHVSYSWRVPVAVTKEMKTQVVVETVANEDPEELFFGKKIRNARIESDSPLRFMIESGNQVVTHSPSYFKRVLFIVNGEGNSDAEVYARESAVRRAKIMMLQSLIGRQANKCHDLEMLLNAMNAMKTLVE